MDLFKWIVTFLPYINLIFALILIFFERRNVSTTLAWLMIFYFVPGFGFILYLTFGQNLSREKIFRLKKHEDKVLKEYLLENEKLIKHNKSFNSDDMKYYEDLMRLNFNNGNSPLTEDNTVEIFADGKSKFDDLLMEIKNAKKFIHIGYYIIKNDDLGKKIINALVEKAKEGVEVRLLYDQLGSRNLRKRHLKPLIDAGGKYAVFFPSLLYIINFRINYRNHRKIVVIDNKIGYVGGFNIGDEYLGKNKRFGYWRDTHIKITGEAIVTLHLRFLLDWRYSSGENDVLIEKYLSSSVSKGDIGMQIVSSGPDTELEQIKYGYVKMVQDAKECILIQTPYLVLDDCIKESLKIAALSGVDVRIMIPNKPDHPFVYWASYHNAGELIRAGAKIYTYEKGFLHAKTVVVDNKICSVGTANMDIRSFRLNFEVNAFIYDKKISMELRDVFFADISDCNELTPEIYKARSNLIKFKESFSRLLSPIL
ncbi:cardiolipin synthase [Oceanirhabdus sp. W0125-5]|uniref:cardiolipin synthase n=1 Tax=Oceanirhabdus sp. W0125-5 TaxID=2999116 RepID=UPI0022F313CD|nr:cardiolipin synthase [Oceanirhabdus sp. W0125-5]WBW99268.1 cardiolipin synthase [Oceanirhabdus sp. W0125-5]